MNAPIRRLAVLCFALFTTILISTTWIQFVRASEFNEDPRNSRTLIERAGRERGPIVASQVVLAESLPADDRYKFQRNYPEGPMYAHVTGYSTILPSATGLESEMGDVLTASGDKFFVRNISDMLTGREAKGDRVELTIVPKLQKAAWDALGDQRGAVVAIEPSTGNILAMVSKPSFNPNTLSAHDSSEVRKAHKALLKDPARPFDNRAIAGRQYPPGSVFKLITAAAALQTGTVSTDTQINAPTVLELPQTTAKLGNSGGGSCSSTGTTTLAEALRISCNTAFAQLGLDMGAGSLTKQAEAFGFGQEFRIPLRVTPSTLGKNMDLPQTAQSAIGQFEDRVTPLQVAMVSAGIANDGVVMEPKLVKSVLGPDLSITEQPSPKVFNNQAISKDTATTLRDMMRDVVQSGTGKSARIKGLAVAGKTGTAQHEPGAPPHAWFTAFAPAGSGQKAQIAVAVVVERGGEAGDQASGGRTAAPIAKKVMEAMFS